MFSTPAFASRCPSRVLYDVIAMLLIALIALVAYKLSPTWFPLAEHRLSPPTECNLNEAPCRVLAGSGWLELGINPRPAPAASPFTLELRSSGLQIRRVDADFAAVGMNMGWHRPQLMPVANGTYRVETALPVCSTGAMRWTLSLLVETATGHLVVPFQLTTSASGAVR